MLSCAVKGGVRVLADTPTQRRPHPLNTSAACHSSSSGLG